MSAVTEQVSRVQSIISDSVETMTEALKNTSVSGKNEQQENNEAHSASAAEGRRLYIGNLAYSTTDDQLKEFFEGFSIESTSIPTIPRTGRAVGYAFVDLTTKAEADRAIAELGGREVLERKVSVQLARKPGSIGSGAKKGGKDWEEGAAIQDGEHTHGPSKRGRSGFRGRGRGRPGRGGAKRNEGEPKTEESGAAESPSGSGQQPLGESTNVKAEVTEPAVSSNHAEGFSGYRPKKKRGPPENGVPSSTKIMVANLPYELSEDQLKELFSAYQPDSAKIALRPIPRYMVRKLQARGEPRKGRGFGFVTLGSEEMQKKAVEEMNGKNVDGREIAVKVAIDSQTNDSEDKENTNSDLGENSEGKVVQNGIAGTKGESGPVAELEATTL